MERKPVYPLEQAKSLSVSKFHWKDFFEKINQEGYKGKKKKKVGKYLGSEDSFSI